MRIKQSEEYNYLFNKSTAYIAGWCTYQGNTKAATFKDIANSPEELQEFDDGYSDCYANSQTSSEAFDYVEGI